MKPLMILVVAAALSVAACSRNEAPAQNETTPAPPPPAATSTEGTTGTAAPAPPPATVDVAPPAPVAAEPPRTAPPAKPRASKVAAGASAAAAPPAASPAPPVAEPAAPPARAEAAPPPPPPPPPAPTFRDVTIPAGTTLRVSVLSNLASNTSAVEDRVRGALASPVMVSGLTALPKGAELSGTVTEARQSGRVKGRASLEFRFESIEVRGETRQIQTARVMREAEDTKREDVKKGGIGAGLGAVVGGIAGGGSGAAIGAIAGGTGTVLATKGRELELPAGTVVDVLLQEALTVRVPLK